MMINGLPVVDTYKRIDIEITPADIRRGKRKDPGACAAAQACIRQLDITAARVHLGRTYLQIAGKKWERYNTPASLKAEIVAVDRGATFMPGEYSLAPCKSYGKRQGGPDKTSRESRRRRKRAHPYHVTVGVRQRGANR